MASGDNVRYKTMEDLLLQANSSEEVKDQNSQLMTISKTRCTVDSNPQQLKWEEKEQVMASQLANMEFGISLLEAQLQEQNKDMNTLKAALKEADKHLESSRVDCQEIYSCLLQEKEALNNILHSKEMEYKKKEMLMTSQLTDMEFGRSLLENQLEVRNKEIDTMTVSLKEAKKQDETGWHHWQGEKSSLLEEKDALNNTLHNKQIDFKEKEMVMTSRLTLEELCSSLLETQLENQNKELNTLKAALKKNDMQSESSRVDWQEEKSSLLQVKETLRNTLQKKFIDLKEKERVMTYRIDNCKHLYEAMLEGKKKELNTLKATLTETEKQSESSRVDWQDEKSSLLQETETLRNTLQKIEQDFKWKEMLMTSQLANVKIWRSSAEAKLEEQYKDTNTLKAALKDADIHFEKSQIQWQEKNASLQQENESLKMTLQKMELGLKEKEMVIDNSSDLHEALLEETKKELNALQAVLKKANKQSESSRVDWQKEKPQSNMKIWTSSAEAKLEEQYKDMNTLNTALKEADMHFEKSQINWQEENVSLHQEEEVLNNTLQKMEVDITWTQVMYVSQM